MTHLWLAAWDQVGRCLSTSVEAGECTNGRAAVVLRSDSAEVKVLVGGGHLSSIRGTNLPAGVEDVNPLWSPPWQTADPSLRRLLGPKVGDGLEGQLLSCIAGHNLCADVFGAHTPGEVERAGLCFHGEAGLVQWEVTDVHESSVTMSAHLRHTCLNIARTYTLKGHICEVEEQITNLCGFERAMGRSQHVTLGEAFLAGGVNFRTNCTNGMTWPDPELPPSSQWATGEEFSYPNVPRKDGGFDDWRVYPRHEVNSDLLTMCVNPEDSYGWFVAERNGSDGASTLALAYAWEREAFPWLMTWEENYGRDHAPWSSATLCRGLEFGSYALAMSRRWCVETGSLFGIPTYEWLDAYETKSTKFRLSIQAIGAEVKQQELTGTALTGLS